MAYMNKNAELKNGYNAYIDSSVDDMGTQMDVGLLLMEAGDTYVYEDAKKEVAILLFSGSVTYEWDGKKVEADRPDCFHHDAYCLLAGCGTKVTITAKAHSELYIQATVNETPYEAVMYTPDKVQVEHKGFGGELMGCMSREIKTFFDLDNAPFSKTAAPGYAMCYAWGIRHLEGDPWDKTRIDDPEHAWLWKADANDHIYPNH